MLEYMQVITSANTSINAKKVPAIFRKIRWQPGTRNLDYGGGKYDIATTYLAKLGVDNQIYDPYNRSDEWNRRVRHPKELYDTCTISNVLNVLDNSRLRQLVLMDAMHLVKRGGTIYITVYSGDKSGVGKLSKTDCWQNNQLLSFYAEELRQWLPPQHLNLTVKNNMITLTTK